MQQHWFAAGVDRREFDVLDLPFAAIITALKRNLPSMSSGRTPYGSVNGAVSTCLSAALLDSQRSRAPPSPSPCSSRAVTPRRAWYAWRAEDRWLARSSVHGRLIIDFGECLKAAGG
jgi:hypothetical protein